MNLNEYLLTKAMEECCEIAQAVSKGIIFGLDDRHPAKGNVANRDIIAAELDDLAGIVEMLRERKLIGKSSPLRIGLKQAKVRRWMKYSRKVGTLKGK